MRWFLSLPFIALLIFSPFALASKNDLLTEYVQLSRYTDNQIEKFDKELDEALKKNTENFLEKSDTYSTLLHLRILLEEKEHLLEKESLEKELATLSPADFASISRLTEKYPQITPEGKKDLPPLSKKVLKKIQLEKTPFHSEKIQPSPGSDGNLTGNTFPQNTWALTYDDGPSGTTTLPLVEVLQDFETKATFFWLAENVERYPAIVQTVKEAGMSLQNHSYTHANLPKVSASQLHKEIVTSTEVETRIYGHTPTFFRCPYGEGMKVSRIRKLIAEQGMIHVFWNVDTLDWKDKDPSSIFARAKKQMLLSKRGIVLFHDIHQRTQEASRLLLNYANSLEGKDKIRWLTLPQIVKELNSSATQKYLKD